MNETDGNLLTYIKNYFLLYIGRKTKNLNIILKGGQITMKFKKLLSVILAVMMVMSVIPVGATGGAGSAGGAGGTGATSGAGASTIIPEGATLIFAEDFESGYTTDTDLLGDGETEITKNGKKVIKLKNGANLADDVASVKVVDGELVIKNTDNTKNNALEMWIYPAEGNKINPTDANSEYYGKQIVYEFDATIAGYLENKFMGISTGTTHGFQRANQNSIITSSGAYAAA